MVVNWYGEGCFKMQSGDLTIVTDPPEAGSGLTPPRGKCDILLTTLAPLPIAYASRGETRRIWGPGEYEIRGAEITGWPAGKVAGASSVTTVFRLRLEELRIGFLGHGAEASEQFLDKLGELDVLFLPVGGASFLTPVAAARLVKQLSPKLVIPSRFKIPGLARKAGKVEEFLAEIGQNGVVPQEKLALRKKDLPAATRVAVLTA